VAFSGSVEDDKVPDKTYTEVEMNNGLKEKELPDTFAKPDYRVLLVAEKYQTDFDQLDRGLCQAARWTARGWYWPGS
jgi:type I restriction enzyme R subunit